MPAPQEQLDIMLAAAREELTDPRGHFHATRPYECGEPGCRGEHPALALARACSRTARAARQMIAHRHKFVNSLEGPICETCGQLKWGEAA